MDDMFKQIVETMNKTVLKDIHFDAKQKENVRQVIYKRKKKRPIKPTLNFLLPIAVASLFILGASYYATTELEIFTREEQMTSLNNDPEHVPPASKVETNIYIPPAQEESYEDMTKEDVVTKLLNTVDYFYTATGKFEDYSIYNDDSDSKSVTEYKISIKNEIGGYQKNTPQSDDKETGYEEFINEFIYNEEKVWLKQNINYTYKVLDYQSTPTRDPITPEEAFNLELKDIYSDKANFRETPEISPGGNSLFPYEITASYLRNTELWDIEKQNEELLGHNTIVLYGKMDEQVINRFKMKRTTDTFRFWVDKDTGILVKYETYDADGQLTGYLHPESLEVNIPIDPQDFVPNLDGYTPFVPYGKKPELDPREAEIEVVDYADSFKEDVEAVVDLMRKDLPFLYEFTHPDLDLFSAGYEKYKNFNHAYLTYTKNETGVVYVCAYHKDSFIRTSTDFNRETGNQLELFTLNGIEWKSYEIKNVLGAKFIGMKGDYIYEVVSQKISFEEMKALLESFHPVN
ncbi:outer membrane lipoprotein-sorting protein [Solibacillus silvestris StLB046]|uniref:Outer membrane lipoprotein-sorting protein n=1 Tax=Solibacillus silvestris (strain StLB046) TaxID=1002809 RepID=F2FAG6_SOLSS|nr:membrane protein [Solibacillus silvestris]BAK16733.1 outer membrane lipoprotein-sorting protein [Solibacillus silvestris StLB046]